MLLRARERTGMRVEFIRQRTFVRVRERDGVYGASATGLVVVYSHSECKEARLVRRSSSSRYRFAVEMIFISLGSVAHHSPLLDILPS